MTDATDKQSQNDEPKTDETRRRRWPWIVLAVVVLLLAVVAAAPYIASSGWGTGLIVGRVDGMLQGHLTVDDLSAGWGGPIRLRGVRLADPDGREVISLPEARLDMGVWGALWSWRTFDQLELTEPTVTVHLAEADSLGQAFAESSLMRAVRPTKPPEPKPEPTELPELVGRLRLAGGRIEVIGPQGDRTVIEALEMTTDLDGFDDIGAELSGEVGGATLAVTDARLNGLVGPEGRLRMEELVAAARLSLARAEEQLTADLEYRHDPAALARFDLARLRKAAEGDARLDLPGLKLTAEGAVDLGPVVEALGAVLPLREGVKMTAARLAVEDLKVGTMETPAADVAVRLADLRWTRDGRSYAAPVIEATFDVDFAEGRGIRLDRVRLGAGEDEVVATGTPERVNYRYRLDLPRLAGWLGELVVLPVDRYTGTVAGEGWLDPKKLEFATTADVEEAEVGAVSGLLGGQVGPVRPGRFRGPLTLSATVSGSLAEGRFASGGNLHLAGLDYGQEKLLSEPLKLTWRGVDVNAEDKTAAGAGIELTSGPVRLTVSDLDAAWGEKASAAGTLTLEEARLGELLAMAATLLEKPDLPKIDRRLSLSGTARTREGVILADLSGRLRDAGGRESSRLKIDGRMTPETGEFNATLAAEEVALADVREVLRSFDVQAAPMQGTGRITVTASRASGDDPITADGEAVVAGLTSEGRRIIDRVELKLTDLRYDPAQPRLTGERISLTGEKVKVTATAFQADLGEDFGADGKAEWSLDVPWAMDVARTFTGRKDLPRGKGVLNGSVELAGDEGEIAFRDLNAAVVSGERELLALTGRGTYVPGKGGYSLDLSRLVADLGYVGEMAAAAGPKELDRYGGRLNASSVAVSSMGKDEGVEAGMEGVLRGLSVDDKPLPSEQLDLAVRRVRFNAGDSTFAVASARVEGEGMKVSADQIEGALGERLSLGGQANARARLETVTALLAPLAGLEQVPELAGLFVYEGEFTGEGPRVNLDGDGRIEQFSLLVVPEATPEQPNPEPVKVTEDRIDLAHHVVIDTEAESVLLKSFTIQSKQLLNFAASGRLEDYGGRRVLRDVKGDFSGAGNELMTVLEAFAPQLAQRLGITGPVSGEFTASGPAYQADATPAFRGVDAQATASWERLTLTDIALGQAKLVATLEDGLLEIKRTTMTAGEKGTLRLAAVVDFRTEEPTLIVPPKLVMLEDVPVRKQVGTVGLSWILPIFYRPERLSGQITAEVIEEVRLPLGESIKTGGAGRVRLKVPGLKLHSKGVFTRLLSLGGLSGPQLLEIPSDTFVIKDGRIYLDDFSVMVGGLWDWKFTGWAGFDERINMTVSVPVTPDLLSEFGVKLPESGLSRVAEQIQRVDIPLTGTRSSPKLDTKAAAKSVLTLIPNLLKTLLKDKDDGEGGDKPLRDLLDALTPGKDKPADKGAESDPSGNDPPPTSTRPAEQERPRPVRDLLDLLGGDK
jgi:hypothetical protein